MQAANSSALARVAAVALLVGAAVVVLGRAGGILPYTLGFTVGATIAMALAGLAVLARNARALLAARLLLWGVVALTAFMSVPGREESLRDDHAHLNWWFIGLGSYVLVCIVLIAVARQRPSPNLQAS